MPIDNIQLEVSLYQMDNQSNREKKGNPVDLFLTPNLRKNIMVMSFIWLVCSYCFYGMSHYISHLTGDVYINVIAAGGSCMCAAFLSIPLMKFMKRKTVVVIANIGSSSCFLIVAFIPEGTGTIVLACTGVFFSFVVFIVAYLYCTEIFPTVVRNASLGITSMMARLGAMIAPFAAGLRPHGKWCAPIAFGVMPLIAALLCLLLPETKNCELLTTLEEAEAFGNTSRPPAERASVGGAIT